MLFKNVAGHNALKQRLIRSYQDGRISHAQLFSGRPGNGGLPLALAFAQYVNCADPGEEDSCGRCSSCLKAEKFIHPDIHFSFPFVSKKSPSASRVEGEESKKKKTICGDWLPEWRESLKENPYLGPYDWFRKMDAENKQANITRDECMEIIHKLSLHAFEGRFKVLIMWMPEWLGKEGNRLLKLIEEPPENTIFLLIAQNKDKILNTILSRTQVSNIPPLSDEEIMNALIKNGVDEKEANDTALLSQGDYHKALQVIDQDEDNLLNQFEEWMHLIRKDDRAGLVKWTENINRVGREAQKHFLEYALRFLREVNVFQLNNSTVKEGKEYDLISSLHKDLDQDKSILIMEEFNNASYLIERNVNSKMIFLNLSIRIEGILKNNFNKAKIRDII